MTKVLEYNLVSPISAIVKSEEVVEICNFTMSFNTFPTALSDDILEFWIHGKLVIYSSTSSLPQTFVGKDAGVAGISSLMLKMSALSFGFPLNWCVRQFSSGVITIDINSVVKIIAYQLLDTAKTSVNASLCYYSANHTNNELKFQPALSAYATLYRSLAST